MAGTGKRKTAAKRTQKKPLNLSVPKWAILLVIIAGFCYAAYLESRGSEQFSSVNKDFIENSTLKVHYIDVGQGDCSLILFGDTSVLIDAGEKENGRKVTEYLNGLGVTKLDYIFATHPHSDHIGGLPDVISSFETVKIIVPRIPSELTPTTKSYENFLLAVKNKGLRLTAASAGNKYTIYSKGEGSDTAVMEIISPISPQSDLYTDLNDFSVIFKLTYKLVSFLFTGDAEKKAEKDILKSGTDISARVLKAGHHGSSTSTNQDFLDAVNPAVSVIQCGVDNPYKHPSVKTVERLENMDIDIYRNDIDGTVIIYSDGLDINVSASES